MQIGLSLIAALAGVFFIAASLTGIQLDSLEQSLAFALTGLPSFLILFLLLVRLTISFWTKNRGIRQIADIGVLRQRLSGLGERVRIQMGIPDVVRFAVGLNSAFVYTKRDRKSMKIVVGDQFLRNATDEEVEGILAHELVHIRQRSLRRVMSTIANEFFAVQLILIFIPQVFIVLGTLFAMTRLLTLPISWRLEYDADRRAAERVGAELVAKALNRLAKTSFVGTSLTHPPLSRRIARLQSLGMRTDS
jgi:Zn-dependent protease with chaperone function